MAEMLANKMESLKVAQTETLRAAKMVVTVAVETVVLMVAR